jgi:hypothetical protein
MSSRRGSDAVLLLCACAFALTGCGSTTIRHVTTTVLRPAATTSTSTVAEPTHSATIQIHAATTASRGAVSPLSGRSALQTIELAASALRRSGDYAMRADLLQAHERTVIALTTSGRRRYEASLTIGQRMFQLISLPGAAYLRGNRAFWNSQSAASAARLAGHWLHVPDTGASSVTRTLGTLAPGTLARCLTEDHGTLSFAGHETVDGTRALIVRDAGDVPGATPSTIAVASSGPPYPLRYDATGVTRRGGRVDVCNNGKGGGATGTIALSQFGRTPSVQAPVTTGGGAPT